MNNVAAATNTSGKELEGLRQLALDMGAATVFSANEAALAMTELAKAGVSVADIQGGALKQTLDLATAGELELAQAAEIASNAMNTFNVKGKDAQIVGAGGAAAFGPALVGIGRTIEGLTKLGGAMKKVGVGKSVGIAAAVVALVNFWRAAQAAEQGAEDLMDAFGSGETTMKELEAQIYDLTAASASFRTNVSDWAEKLVAGVPTARDELDALWEEMVQGRIAARDMSGASKRIEEAQLRVVEALILTARAKEEDGVGSQKARAEAQNLALAEDALAVALKEEAIAAAEARIEDQKRADVRRTLAGITRDVTGAELDIRDAHRNLRDERAELNELEAQGITSGRKYQVQVDAVTRAELALGDARQRSRDAIKELIETTQAARNQGKLTEKGFLELADAFGLSQGQAKRLADDLPNGIARIEDLGDKGKLTKAQVEILTDAVEQLQNRMLGMPHSVRTKFEGQGLSTIIVGTERYKQLVDALDGKMVVITYQGVVTGVHKDGSGAGTGGTHTVGLTGAKGGWIPGHGNKDSVPLMAMPGEYLVSKKPARVFAPLLEAINNNGMKLQGPTVSLPAGAGASYNSNSTTTSNVTNINVKVDARGMRNAAEFERTMEDVAVRVLDRQYSREARIAAVRR